MRGSVYDERLERELSAIEALQLSSWFLALDAIAAFARERRIQVLGRGSAVGSLVVHLVGIGPVDPLEQGLLFERFLRPGRGSPFDVDLDLPTRRREEVIDWVLARWGPCAAAVGAHQRFGPRSARRGAEAALGPGERIDERLRERLTGAPRGLSVHPGGVVLAGTPIRDVVPLEMAPKGIAATQFDGRSLDALGIVKLDFLGNTCLDEIGRAIELVRRADGGHPLAKGGPAAIPADDPATLRRLGAGDTIGCAQIETPATRASLRRRPIRSIDDLTAALAAVRPGPSSEGGPPFEEDVMRLLSQDGTVAMEEADEWRSAIVATGGDAQALAALGRRYLALALGRGAAPERASEAWSKAAPFASYAFSKAHAASYALLAYRAAFLRTHYPLEWGCAVMDAHGGAYLERTIAAEVARWGIRVRPPAINESGRGTCIRRGRELLLGLDRIRGVSGRTKAGLLREREAGGPYRSLTDLVRRVRPDRREFEALVLSGACDALDPLSAEGYPFVHEAIVLTLRSGLEVDETHPPAWRIVRQAGSRSTGSVERYRALVRAKNELRYLGAAPSGHPLGILRGRSAQDGCRTIADVLREGDPEVTIAALPAATRRVETARGAMRYVTWEDETGLLESRIGPAALARLGGRFRGGGAFRVSGRMDSRGPVPRLEVEGLRPLESRGPGR
jgi:DNA polymerase III alpha subunit